VLRLLLRQREGNCKRGGRHAFPLDFPKKIGSFPQTFLNSFFISFGTTTIWYCTLGKGSCGCVSAAAAWPCCPRSFCEQKRKGNVSLITLFLASHGLYVAYSAISYDFT
jgi:hypothetical protein